ncbi:Molybdenum cofactor guanylyltransferase [Sinobacterium norvegicum]|uniref:Molybdenum cofactor guanylyltransferase n=1 Tax=Sinobacterium norvegicum TaxID=1641715 RepID=A0ABM9AI81_9GAMM|nr:molybdenum cofactor guanylyltransferase MobA [Sinobacterium norvegicum]CAH0992753.1 Molybdenum cofactor guanylyltransferase [Sinobacterium norvegicum]
MGDIAVAILAGGESSRLGGNDKGLLTLAGKPLVEYLLAELAVDYSSLYFIANRNQQAYSRFGFPVYSDLKQGFHGPLMGIATALHYSEKPWTLIVPCDAPRINRQCIKQLINERDNSESDIIFARDSQFKFPVLALIKTTLLDSLLQALEDGDRKIVKWYFQHKNSSVEIDKYFTANINTAENLQEFEAALVAKKAKALNYQLLRGRVPVDAAVCRTAILGVAAFSGTGKTTLLTKLLPLLRQGGLNVAVIKHAHHLFDVDKPGKDSYNIRQAGAQQVLLSSARRVALMVENLEEKDRELAELLTFIDCANIDLIMVEGFKKEPFAKLELHRESCEKPLICSGDSAVLALAADSNCDEKPATVMALDLNDTEAIAAFIIYYVAAYAEV